MSTLGLGNLGDEIQRRAADIQRQASDFGLDVQGRANAFGADVRARADTLRGDFQNRLGNFHDGVQGRVDQVAAQMAERRAKLVEYTKTTWDKVYDFINGTCVTAEYGYRESYLVGIGSVILMPAALAINMYQDACHDGNSVLMSTAKKAAAIGFAILVSPALLLGSAVKGIGLLTPTHIGEMDSSNPALGLKRASPQHVDQVYSLVTIFHDICEKHGVPYFAEAGSALGMLREEGMIQWDDDFDAGMMEEHQGKIEEMRADLEAQGIMLQDRAQEGHPHVYNLSFTDEVLREKFGVTDGKKAFMDIFVFKQFEDGTISYKNDFMRNQFGSYYFIEGDTNPENLNTYNFGPKIPDDFPSPKAGQQLQIRSVNREAATGLVHRYYGKDCLDYGVQTHRHIVVMGIPLPIPNLARAKYKILKEYATGNMWKKEGAPADAI